MLNTILNEMSSCERCSFADSNYPPLVPVRMADNARIMFIGENPSWEFGQRVPFDGITNSGRALHENYLLPLKRTYNLKESDFWITDLFKCRYPKSVYRKKSSLQDLISTSVTTCATTWLAEEIRFTKPEIIITLGDKEVYQRFRRIFNLTCTSAFADAAYKIHEIEISGHKCKLFPTCHPDISYNNSRKPIPSRKWSKLHQSEFINSLKDCFTRNSVQ